jgi:hypothetical protein
LKLPGVHLVFSVFRTDESAKVFASQHIQRFLDRNKIGKLCLRSPV